MSYVQNLRNILNHISQSKIDKSANTMRQANTNIHLTERKLLLLNERNYIAVLTVNCLVEEKHERDQRETLA